MLAMNDNAVSLKNLDACIASKLAPTQSLLGALAVFVHAFFTVFMVFGAGFAAVVLAVTCNRMLAQFAVAILAVAFTFAIDHESDS